MKTNQCPKRKIEFAPYPLFDHTSLERHLEEQALKGWFLHRMGFWRYYRRGEPSIRYYRIGYYPKGTFYKPADAGEYAYVEQRAESGWKLAAESGPLKIFSNEQENPAPMETDPALQIENIRLATRKIRMINVVLFLVCVLYTMYFIVRLFDNPVRTLSSGLRLMYAVLSVLFLIEEGAEILAYRIWYMRAIRNAKEQGIFTDTFHFKWIHRLFYPAICIHLVIYSASMGWLWFVAPFLLLIWFACTSLADIIRTKMRRNGVPGWVNGLLVFAMIFVIYFGGTMVMTTMVLRHADGSGGSMSQYGFVFNDPADMVPIHLRDLTDDEVSVVFSPNTIRGSVILSQLEAEEYGEALTEHQSQITERPPMVPVDEWAEQTTNRVYHLRYQLTKVHVKCLMSITEKALIRQEAGVCAWEEVYAQGTGAQQILRTTCSCGSGPEIRYLICMEDRFLVINVQEELTDIQFAGVCERVRGL